MAMYIGCSGYHYKDWKGKFYPDDLKKENWLEYYSEKFNSVEINNTFYNVPEKKTLEEWSDITPSGFRFAVKGSRYITHMKKLNDPEEHLKKFYTAIKPLKKKINVILWQLPGNLHKNLSKIRNFCERLEKDYDNVIEFRHSSWFNEEVFKLLANHNVITCSLSTPDDLPEFLEDRTGSVYLRFHGKHEWYRHNYRKQELQKWIRMIEESDARNYYIYFNNDYNAKSAHNALRMKELMS